MTVIVSTSPPATLGGDDAQQYNSPSTQRIECFVLAVSRPVQRQHACFKFLYFVDRLARTRHGSEDLSISSRGGGGRCSSSLTLESQ